jgi:hypothetical protein
MLKKTVLRFTTLGVAMASIACGGGGGDSTGPGPGGNNGNGQFRFTAKIDGANWASTAGVETVGVPVSVAGLFALTGSQVGANGQTIVISLYNIPGPGTYPLGTGVSVPGGNALISTASGGGWKTPQSGADGSITLTTLTATRMEGTFNFTAVGFTGGATGTKTVTDGSFSLEIRPNGTIGPLADNVGHKMSATLNGAAFNGADVASIYSGTTFGVTATTNTRSVSFTLSDVTGAGTYALSNALPLRTMGVSLYNGTQLTSSHSSSVAGSSGSVTITSLTATRVKGTFTGVLGVGLGSGGTMTVTNGTFDVGRLN